METTNNRITVLVIFSFYLTTAILGQNAPAVRWGHQLITPTNDSLFRTMVIDSSDGIYIAVSRRAKDAPDSAPKEQYILKFNQDGEQLWCRQLGENTSEDPLNINVQGLAADDQENIYVFGYTDCKLGREKFGENDAFVAKYNQAGTQLWTGQLGSPRHDVCTGLDIDASGNVYIAGYTYGPFVGPNKGQADIFIAAYDQTGTLLWKDQVGTAADDRAMDLSLGNNNDIYICGSTSGALVAQNNNYSDFMVARYESTGKSIWLYQYGTWPHFTTVRVTYLPAAVRFHQGFARDSVVVTHRTASWYGLRNFVSEAQMAGPAAAQSPLTASITAIMPA